MDKKRIADLLSFSTAKMQKVNLFESSKMFCDLYCFEPGQDQPLHTHEGSDKIYFVLEGDGIFTVGDQTQVMRAGETTCAWSGQPHGVNNSSSNRLTCLVFMAPHPNPKLPR
jgi:quercetin dioxygenase-like cupin family protein